MSFKRLEGHNVLFRAIALNAAQMQLVGEIIAHYNGETKLTRKQCRDAHGVLRGKKAAPYFISKNVACKVKGEHGMYNLGVLKLSAEAAKAPVVTAETDTPAPKKKSAKAKGKKGAAPKREKKAKKGTETPAEPVAEAASETV